MNKVLKIDFELLEICRKIISENKKSEEWDLIESDDYYQTKHYIGGWDSTENAFCFSYYDDRNEYWFQFNLEEVKKIESGEIKEIIMIDPS